MPEIRPAPRLVTILCRKGHPWIPASPKLPVPVAGCPSHNDCPALHGARLAKLVHFPVPHPGVPNPLPTILVAAAFIELIGGALIAIGMFTRPVAFLAAGEMATGYFLYHFPQAFWPIVNMGEAAILYCFVFLYLAAAGPGAFSIDAAWEKNG